MDKTYWLNRVRSAKTMARNAVSSRSRLVHYELAGRYSIKAAEAATCLLTSKAPASEQPALRLLDSGKPEPGSTYRQPPFAEIGTEDKF